MRARSVLPFSRRAPYGSPWMRVAQHARLERACAELTPPFACVDLDAFESNAADLVRRAAGTPLRLASKSVRCRALQRRVLDGPPGFRGILALTLPEALWLGQHGLALPRAGALAPR